MGCVSRVQLQAAVHLKSQISSTAAIHRKSDRQNSKSQAGDSAAGTGRYMAVLQRLYLCLSVPGPLCGCPCPWDRAQHAPVGINNTNGARRCTICLHKVLDTCIFNIHKHKKMSMHAHMGSCTARSVKQVQAHRYTPQLPVIVLPARGVVGAHVCLSAHASSLQLRTERQGLQQGR